MAYIGRDTDKISNVEVLDNITFNGSSSYTLQKGGSNFTPSSANTLLLSIDGVVQAGNFTVSGSTIDFGTAVAGTSTCDFVLHYGVGLITIPADGTVSLDKLSASGTKDNTTFLRGDNTFAAAGSPSITDNGNATSITIDSDENITFHGSSIFRNVNNSSFALAGGTASNVGGNITLYGGASGIANGIKFRAAGTEIMRMTSNGLTFNGDTAAANALDDYEEGTWSPAIGGTTIQTGYYTKVGRMVIATFGDATNSAVALTNGSSYTITGLPFSQIASGWQYASTPIISYADASASYKSFPLTGRQDNGGNIHVANRSGQDVSTVDPLNLCIVYQTN